MTNISKLPLIALVTLGLAACGGSESAAEKAADRAEERADVIEERADEMEDKVDDMDMDDTMMADKDAMMDDDMMGDEEVMVTVRGVQPNAGKVYVTLQTKDDFPAGASKYGEAVDATGDAVTVMFDGVAMGEYVAAAFQDLDGNGTLKMGTPAPKEPWGFSGYSGGAPSFDKLMMNVGENGGNTEITLNQ